jgi:hypothetical protein
VPTKTTRTRGTRAVTRRRRRRLGKHFLALDRFLALTLLYALLPPPFRLPLMPLTLSLVRLSESRLYSVDNSPLSTPARADLAARMTACALAGASAAVLP